MMWSALSNRCIFRTGELRRSRAATSDAEGATDAAEAEAAGAGAHNAASAAAGGDAVDTAPGGVDSCSCIMWSALSNR